MRPMKGFKRIFLPIFLLSVFPSLLFANETSAVAVSKVFERAKKNENWKQALLTGKNEQVVLINVNPKTNPSNESGTESNKFEQVIFVIEGGAKAEINGQSAMVKAGDMIFIPPGIEHNLINLSEKQPLKLISIYSTNDLPNNSVYKKKSDAPH